MNNRNDAFEANEIRVSEAFSAQAPVFDEAQHSNEILHWMRRQVHNQMERYLKPGDKILELNAGTGIDAVHFAHGGHTVVAVDYAAGMIEQMRKKAELNDLTEKISAYCCSFTDLKTVPVQSFDVIYSNFGGLNCIPDIGPVAAELRPFLRKGTLLFLTIMPPVCPWEILYAVRGRMRFAFRRLQKSGTTSRIEGRYFLSWYFTPREVKRAFGPDFTTVSLHGVASLTPPPYMLRLQRKFPRLLHTLMRMDEIVSAWPPFNQWADYFFITLRYDPQYR